MKYVLDKVKIFLFWFGEEGKVVDSCSTAEMTIGQNSADFLKALQFLLIVLLLQIWS